MIRGLEGFELIVRRARLFTEAKGEPGDTLLHPFEERNLQPGLPDIVRSLFDDGHFAQATFEAFKFLDKHIQGLSGRTESGFKLMMTVFPENSPIIALNAGSTTSEKDEQKGFQFLFAGSVLAIRNPRGHEFAIRDSPDQCLDHLALVSMLLRRLNDVQAPPT